MAKKTEAASIAITSKAQAQKALERMEEIQAKIDPLMKEAVELKKSVTAYAVEKKVDVIQLDECYYRQINRETRMWVATDDDMPTNPPKKARSLKSICAGVKVTVKGKKVPLWNLVTKRVPDPEAIDRAVSKGWIDEDEIHKAFLSKPQAPFLQRYEGEAD